MQKQNEPSSTVKKFSKNNADSPRQTAMAAGAKRGGRKSMFDENTLRAVIQAWEQRDAWPYSMRLDEFLEEKFGVMADGTPVVGPPTFYGWRKNFIRQEKDAA